MKVTTADIDKAQREIETKIKFALQSFIGQKIDQATLYNIKSTVVDILEPYFEKGILDEIPHVDVNNRDEMSAILDKISELNGMSESESVSEADIDAAIAQLKLRYVNLKNSTDPTNIHISLKDPRTLDPYIWPVRGDYDH